MRNDAKRRVAVNKVNASSQTLRKFGYGRASGKRVRLHSEGKKVSNIAFEQVNC